MIGLLAAIIIFNTIAYFSIKRLTGNQILHIWLFTVVLQLIFDVYIDLKYHGYWYLSKDIDLLAIPQILLLVPPVNLIFLNYYPFKKKRKTKVIYIAIWVCAIVLYELVTLIPEPWGYFHYGWWRIWYSILLDPFLFIILIKYYRFICRLEAKADKHAPT
ncbi:hypothetical protein CEQ21_24085 [Niallia circulans]|uniref:Uncharacterized protein n=1 Tax=Niallia circulans TaxID=1397 RepID=A0A553SNC0_NIACI|nr:hypothetical protein [Niallia circulans]TRZ38472.1 hypothetical protein CEQ21_24085 [Niallia circulans]